MRNPNNIIIATLTLICCTVMMIASCDKTDTPAEGENGKIILHFSHYNDGEPLEFDTMKYTNAAGNNYLVNEIQYFISDIKLHKTDGSIKLIDDWDDIHYVDTDIESTQSWQVYDPIGPGDYEKISFTFGISEEKNQSLMFLNPPERDMFWPEFLGGGYHYMKLNGKWLADDEIVKPFDFHLGIGQIYSGGVIEPDSITAFVQNYFEVELPASSFSISDGETINFEIIMNIENWFQDPNTFNHDEWGGDIMQKQDAMKLGCENGQEDVFSIYQVFIVEN